MEGNSAMKESDSNTMPNKEDHGARAAVSPPSSSDAPPPSGRILLTSNGVGSVVNEKRPLDNNAQSLPQEQPPPYNVNYTLIPAARGAPITLQPVQHYV